VWGNFKNDEGIQRIAKLQKRAARIILDAPFLTPTRELFENLNWLSELYANDFFIIFVFGRITAKLLLDTDLRFLV
jgi:hypothetical protein